MSDNKNIGMFIPAELCHDDNLSWIEKVLLTKIQNLENNGGGCFASNAYLGGFLQVSEGHVSNMINGLIGSGYLRREGGKRYRRLFYVSKQYSLIPQKDGIDRSLFHKNMELEPVLFHKNMELESFQSHENMELEVLIPQKHGIEEVLFHKNMDLIPCFHGHSIRDNKEDIYISIAERVYRKYFPDIQLDIFAQETLVNLEVEEEVWDETVKHWAMNSYRPRRIFEMHQMYLDKLAKRPQPSAVGVVYCDDCRDLGGLKKTEEGLVKCNHRS